ncbi:hypothetical protein ABZ671_11805 [Micromonospora sp. NPDC006766]|uniref:hypothetical protein n=1 Tax=Micromonospora sp. NPDC006766 TaxID=3154778 RepID=UPI0033FED09F
MVDGIQRLTAIAQFIEPAAIKSEPLRLPSHHVARETVSPTTPRYCQVGRACTGLRQIRAPDQMVSFAWSTRLGVCGGCGLDVR